MIDLQVDLSEAGGIGEHVDFARSKGHVTLLSRRRMKSEMTN
jgi:hypothetical protein